ncbi:hypothetical protein TREMEDRAFT_16198, partial [Tremella mesenterica DSM 1558]|uniref:uncharacterized protein n=1 Tax=Tremella mesenterica (strain ATCC 24925 / CBS 8224 / DSM 1558 / NBRC 9311 / NRRL Y-6157 / RJB 2259-6 / UBC 559-6) TaxID=578456 RepID=UPI0003F48F3A
AVKILENERETLAYAAEVITQEGLVDKVDFWKGYKYEVFTSPEGAQSSSSAYETYLQARYQSSLKEEPYEWALCTDPLEAAQKTRVSNAIAYNRGPAGSVHPHKLTTELLKIAMRSGAELYSWAPVKNLSRFGEGWEVETSRGMIKAGVVVLCTNAYTGGLFPESERGMGISAHLTPYRGHCANYTPPLSYSGPKSLDHSYVVENGMYIVSTPHSGIVAGTWAAATINHGLATRDDIYAILDDSTVLPSVEKWMKGWFERTYEGWKENGRGEGMGRLWTGIMAHSHDLLPLVGPIPNKPNLFAAVGFHGHGMARILTITRGLSQLLSTGKWDERLPTSFQITEMRLSRAK